MKVLHRWKFENGRALYRLFRPRLEAVLDSMKEMPDRILHIVSGRSGYDVRSYRPCGDLAAVVARKLMRPCGGDVEKSGSGRQSNREYVDRFVKIRGSFSVVHRPEHPQMSYLLVEDVFTTGATCNEIARELKRSGAARVVVLSMLMREHLHPGDGLARHAETAAPEKGDG